MNINHTNKQPIHDVLIKDMQARLFKDHEQYVLENATPGELPEFDEHYANALSLMINKIVHCNSMRDINDLCIEYSDIFNDFDDYGTLATQDGTMNYVIGLLINNKS